MAEYPSKNINSVPGFDTGRVLYITKAENFTPADIMQFLNEGFALVSKTVANGTISFDFASFTEAEGTYTLTVGETSYTSSAVDVNFAAGE